MRRILSCITVLLLLLGCDRAPPPASAVGTIAAPAPASDWNGFVNDFIEATLRARPHFAVAQGRHEFDGQLPDFSAAGIAAEVARLHTARAAALAFDTDALDAHQRYLREYVLSRIDTDLFWMEEADWPRRNPRFYSDQIDPDVYLTRPYAPLATRMAAYTRYAEAIPVALAQIRSQLRTPMPRSYADLGAAVFGGYGDFMDAQVPAIFAEVEDPAAQQRFAAANSAAATAMRELGQWFAGQRASANDDFALGAGLFKRMLFQTERVDTDLATLNAIGAADLERNLSALKDACAQFAPGRTLLDCVAKAQADKPEGGPVAAARQQLVVLKQFLLDRHIVSIPGDEAALVEESPPYQRFNAAYISIPGPWEKGMPATYYIAPPDPSWSAQEQAAYIPGRALLNYTSVHEVWPGHFLNFLHANRSPDLFGRVFVGYAFAEGWAHYTEQMMWDAGLDAGDPGAHIGQLLEALLRNVRFQCAIGMHTEGMSMTQCEAMFREQGMQDAGNARQQAARGTFDPAYLNYTMGKLLIQRLRDDWTASRGGRAAWQEFHDTFLSYGGPPIPLVRAQMLGAEAGAAFPQPDGPGAP